MTAPPSDPALVRDRRICLKCRKRAADGGTDYCRGCRYVLERKPAEETLLQVATGMKSLRQPDGYFTWPYQQMDHYGGPIPLGQVAYIAANTGVGKTTFCYDLVRRLVLGQYSTMNGATRAMRPQGVTVMPLETSPEDWRLSLAASLAGIDHGDIHEYATRWHEFHDIEAKAVLERVEPILQMQATDATFLEHLDVLVPQQVTSRHLDEAFASAAARGHKVVLIDHIDQVGAEFDEEAGRKATGLPAVEAVNNALLEYARHYKVTAIAMSQLNGGIKGDGDNPLLRFQKPQLHHLMFHSLKTKNAAQIWGLHRPLRIGLSREDFLLAREGTIDPLEVLEPGRVGLAALKLRHRGKNEGRVVELHYQDGRIRDVLQEEHDRDQAVRTMAPALSHNSFVGRDRPKKTAAAADAMPGHRHVSGRDAAANDA